jgi:hypothetical protein
MSWATWSLPPSSLPRTPRVGLRRCGTCLIVLPSQQTGSSPASDAGAAQWSAGIRPTSCRAPSRSSARESPSDTRDSFPYAAATETAIRPPRRARSNVRRAPSSRASSASRTRPTSVANPSLRRYPAPRCCSNNSSRKASSMTNDQHNNTTRASGNRSSNPKVSDFMRSSVIRDEALSIAIGYGCDIRRC